MFTGIIEEIGKIIEITNNKDNKCFTIESKLVSELKVDQSFSHDGVCLTVVEVNEKNSTYKVTAIKETLDRTSLANWQVGYEVNLERAMKADGRFDGHFVQGHVDTVGKVDEFYDGNGSWMIFITYPEGLGYTVSKGSITVNGVSLTVVDSFPNAFSVAIIPYTWEHTNLSKLQKDSVVNLEFDIFGKYVQRLQQLEMNRV